MTITFSKYHLIVCIISIFISCNRSENTSQAIKNSESIRTQAHLLPIDDNYKLDSTRRMTSKNYESISSDWYQTHLEYATYIKTQKTPTLYYLEEHYSHNNSVNDKIIWFKVENHEIQIAQEQDSYLLKRDTNVICFLVKNYKYDKNKHEHSLDTLPSPEFLEQDKILLKAAIELAKSKKADLCLENNMIRPHPTRRTLIDKATFDKYLKIRK